MIDELQVSLLFSAVLKFLLRELSPRQSLMESIGQRWDFSQNAANAERDLSGLPGMPKLQGSQSVSCVSLFISLSESSLNKIPRKIPHCTYVPCDLFLLKDNIPQAKLLSAKQGDRLLVPNASKYEEEL